MKRLVTAEFLRYFCAGCLAFGADLLVMVGFTELAGLHYLVANLFGFAAGLTVSYLFCIRWVFTTRRLKRTSAEFTVFLALTLVGLAVNEGILWLIVEQFGTHYITAKVVATGGVFVLNFLMKKAVLFR